MKNFFSGWPLGGGQGLIFLLFFFPILQGCPPPASSPPPRPLLIAIGADISKTFKDNDPIQGLHIRQVCELVLQAGGGGIIVFQTIGSPTKKDPIRLELQALPDNCNSLPASAKIRCKQQRQSIKQGLKDSIEIFIGRCIKELEQPKQPDTDINGFFRKINTLVSGPAGDDHDILIYLHTDGIHDIKGNKDLNCAIAPQSGVLCASGWVNTNKCNISHELATPDDFIILLKKYIRKQKDSKHD